MYKLNKISIVVPSYNEETQIEKVIATIPDFVDCIIIIDDSSTDDTVKIVKDMQKINKKITLIEHKVNQGVGGAIASGYKWSKENDIDAAVVMAGDGQMDPNDLPALLDPVVSGEVDYSKANRLIYQDAYTMIPKVRFFGNAILSLLTKIASGYWHISDSQSGYTAINKQALKIINWDKMYKRYGQPNDLLVRLNIHNFKVRDIPLKPVYGVGEQSKMKVKKVIFTISKLLIKMYIWRIKEKYILRDFHPLVLFYIYGFLVLLFGALFLAKVIFRFFIQGTVPEISLMIVLFCFGSGLQSIFFAMFFDQDSNKHLK
jgi:glycosyltransferase involved in cell wall biosynthesis